MDNLWIIYEYAWWLNPTPLKNMSSSIGMMLPNWMGKKTCSKLPSSIAVAITASSAPGIDKSLSVPHGRTTRPRAGESPNEMEGAQWENHLSMGICQERLGFNLWLSWNIWNMTNLSFFMMLFTSFYQEDPRIVMFHFAAMFNNKRLNPK